MHGRSPVLQSRNTYRAPPDMKKGHRVQLDITETEADRFIPTSSSRHSLPRMFQFAPKHNPISYDYSQPLASAGQSTMISDFSTLETLKLPSGPDADGAFAHNHIKLNMKYLESDLESEASSICHSPGWDDLSGKKSKEKREKKRQNRGQRDKMKIANYGNPASQPKKLSKPPPKNSNKFSRNEMNDKSGLDPFLHVQHLEGKGAVPASKVKIRREGNGIRAKTFPLPFSSFGMTSAPNATKQQDNSFIGGLKLRKPEEANVQEAIRKFETRDSPGDQSLSSRMPENSRSNSSAALNHMRLLYHRGKSEKLPSHRDRLFQHATRTNSDPCVAPVNAEDLPKKNISRRAYPFTTRNIQDKLSSTAYGAFFPAPLYSVHRRTDDSNFKASQFEKSMENSDTLPRLRRRSLQVRDYIWDEPKPLIGSGIKSKKQESLPNRGPEYKLEVFNSTVQDVKMLRSFTGNTNNLEANSNLQSAWCDDDSQIVYTPVSAMSIHNVSLGKAERVLGETITTPLVENFVERLPYSRSSDSINRLRPSLLNSYSRSATVSSEEYSTHDEYSNITSPAVSRSHSSKDKSPKIFEQELPRMSPQPNLSARDETLSWTGCSAELSLENSKDHPTTPASVTREQQDAEIRSIEVESKYTPEEQNQKSNPHRYSNPDSYFLPVFTGQPAAWTFNEENVKFGRGLIRRPVLPKGSPKSLNLSEKNYEPSDYLQTARQKVGLAGTPSQSPRSPNINQIAQKPIKPFAKMFVICCSCKYFHDLPSKVYECMAGPSNVVSEENLGVSGVMTTSVECPWCEHGMTTACCAGYAAIVYMKERLH